MSDEGLPEADRLEDAPHPRTTVALYGQEAAERAFLAALASGRPHHGWMIAGPRGVGKATLAWRIARHMLAGGAGDSLDMDPADPVFRRAAALAAPQIFLARRPWDDKARRLRTAITIDEIRALRGFFQLSATEAGWRVAIVDAADELTPQAANALLKTLEEPPPRALILLVCHQPARLLPTIRSRCRELRLHPLAPQDLSDALVQAGGVIAPEDRQPLAELAAGSVGEAFRLTNAEGLETYADLIRLFSDLPRLDRARAIALAETAAGKQGADRFDLILTLIELFLSRLARSGTLGQTPPEAAPGEARLIARLCPHPAAARHWADLSHNLAARARRGKAVNLDPAALLMDILLKIDETAGPLAS